MSSDITKQVDQLHKELAKEPLWPELVKKVCREVHPPRYKPSYRGRSSSEKEFSMDWAYQSGEYDATEKIRGILLRRES